MDNILHSKTFGEGQPLVILHGLFGMLDNWQGLAKQFAQFFETHIVDQRNHGKSFHSDEHTYDLMCEDLKHYLDSKGIDKVYLLGHSMGGKTAMLFAVKYPERVEKLVVVDIAPKYYPPHHQEILKGLLEVQQSHVQSRKQADELLTKHFSNIGVRQFLLKSLYWKTKERLDFRFNLEVLNKEIAQVGEQLLESYVYPKPCMFVDGELSQYILEEDVELIEEHFPDSEIATISGAGHWVHAENPKSFFEVVSRFLIY